MAIENTAGNSALSFYQTNGFWTAASSYQFFISSSIPSKKSVFCPSALFSLDEACYRDCHTFGVPEIWFVHLSMKKPLFFRGFL
jgi:hypothetical protein